jgi:hypothetical protein
MSFFGVDIPRVLSISVKLLGISSAEAIVLP